MTRGVKTLDGAGAFNWGADMSNPVGQAIEAIARGEIVVVTDDNDRENEGDMIVAASLCTTEKMAFIIRNGCGIVCAPVTGDEARRLQLAPMVAMNDAPQTRTAKNPSARARARAVLVTPGILPQETYRRFSAFHLMAIRMRR